MKFYIGKVLLVCLQLYVFSTTVFSEEEYKVLRPETSKYIYTSEHFAVRWNDKDNVVLTEAEINTGLANLEAAWKKFTEEIGFEKPYWDDSVKYKVSVNVSDQGWATGAGTGIKDPEIWVHYNAYKNAGVLAHEFAHALQFATRALRDSKYVGWMWESHAQWMRHQMFPNDVDCAEMLVNMPHLYYGSTRNRYCNWHFWEFLKDKYGYKIINDIWSKGKKLGEPGYLNECPFTILARNQNWSVDILNDHFGEWAMHNVTWDYKNGAVYRKAFGSYLDRNGGRRLRVTLLEEIDKEKRRYAVPHFWAPQRWGYNLVQLFPEKKNSDGVIKVIFRGVVQDKPATTQFGSYANQPDKIPNPDSDWRWGIVAVDKNGKPRYSELQRGSKGSLSFNIYSTDSTFWLVVVATPKTIHQIMWDQMYYTIYRYPWIIQLEGAFPEGYQPNAPKPTSSGSYHPNGGGWVASGAKVDSTAYVGPRAIVLKGTVSGKARIEDFAIVDGGTVTENARVGAMTIVNGNTRISGSAYVATVMGTLADNGNFTISGTAQLIGDIELRTNVSKGVFYGLVESANVNDPQYGANRTQPMPEVTKIEPYKWPDEPEVVAYNRIHLEHSFIKVKKSEDKIYIDFKDKNFTPLTVTLFSLQGRVLCKVKVTNKQLPIIVKIGKSNNISLLKIEQGGKEYIYKFYN